jgi:hypothetical protein
MAANNALRVTDIDFDGIKRNLQTFLSSQTELQDYNYESSAMQTIINLLAYNTYYNAMYTNFVANEMFLDSALIRENVVSRAKMLGYTPTSTRGATARIQVNIEPTDSPSSITIPANTAFTALIDNITYTFATSISSRVQQNSNGDFITTVILTEGDPAQESYIVSTNSPERYYINNIDVDTTSLKVTVQESSSNTSTTTFSLANDLTTINGNSAVYFIDESVGGKYEVTFGDGILGKQLRNSNIIRFNYKVANGSELNGTNTFSGPNVIAGYSDYTFNVVQRAAGGADKQSIDSIKFNAPRSYQSQNRAVTTDDYKNIVLGLAPDIQAVNVWGGELNKPPIYGKVFISALPSSGESLTSSRKREIESLLNDSNTVTIEAVVVDPSYLYVVPAVEVFYNPNKTSKSADTLLNQVDSVLNNFSNNDLGYFKSTYYVSELIKKVDKIDDSVISAYVKTNMQKRFIPITSAATSYVLNFNNAIFNPHPGHRYALSSTSFTYQGFTCYIDDDGNGIIRIYRITQGARTYVNSNAGTVNYATGRVDLTSLLIPAYAGDAIKVTAVPREYNITTNTNQIIQIADADIAIINNNSKITEAKTALSSSTIRTTPTTETGLNENSLVY